jgi:hypothetical protein
MKKLNELVKDVEKDLVIGLTISVRRKKISFDDSKKIAKDFVEKMPFLGYEDLFEKLNELSNKHRIIRKVYVKHAPDYFDIKTNYILFKMRQSLKDRNIEKAISIAKRINYARI